MQSFKLMTKFWLLLIIVIFEVGCSSLASNPNACREAPFVFPLPNSVVGPIFQFSPCTSIEALRIETGRELAYIRERIVDELDKGTIGGGSKLFGSRMGCAEVEDEFFSELLKNRNDIFGAQSPQSDRQVVTMVRKITKSNPILKEACWKR